MNVLKRFSRGALAALTIAVLAGCGGNGATAPNCNVPTGTPTGPPVIATLVAPAPGATGVSTGPLDITIDNARGTDALFVTDGTTGAYATNFRQANPPSNDVRIGTVAQLAPHTTYQVYAVSTSGPPTAPAGCPVSNAILSRSVLIGSFTTQ